MNVDMEREVRKIFSKARLEKKETTIKRPTILFTLLAFLATLIITFQTIAIAPPKTDINTKPPISSIYKMNKMGHGIQPALYMPIETEFHCVGCAHLKAKSLLPEQNTIRPRKLKGGVVRGTI